MKSISVLIPTVTGREEWLQQTISGYVAHTPPKYDLEFIVLRDRPTCGIGWQQCAQRASGDYLHFSNDDIYPWMDWADPLIEVVEQGYVAAPWISHGPWGQFYAAPEGQVPTDRLTCNHSAMPFMSASQFWELVNPICATHYGVDNWIAHRVHEHGVEIIGRTASVICHFASKVGRQGEDPDWWTEQDLLDYDCNIALPEYLLRARDPRELPPDRLTAVGLARARQWRMENVK